MKTKHDKIIEKQAELIKYYESFHTLSSICIDHIKSELVALQAEPEEEHYPKEFIEWCITHISHSPIKYTDHNGKIFLNITEIFKHWKTLK